MLFRLDDFTIWACLSGACLAAGIVGFVMGRLVAFGEFVRAIDTGNTRKIIDLIRDLEE
jgi:hypothetical protein